MTNFQLTAEQMVDYAMDGYVIVKNFLDEEEVKKLYGIATGDGTLAKTCV